MADERAGRAGENALTDEDRTAARRAGEPERWDAEVLTSLMSTPQGRFWCERLLEFCGGGRAVYHYDGDALGMAARSGKMEVLDWMETQLQTHCPDLYLRMVRERRERILRAKEKADREEARRAAKERSGFDQEGIAVSAVEEMADQQLFDEQKRAEAEAKARAKTKPKE